MSRNTFRSTSGRTALAILFALIALIAPASVVAPNSFAATNKITLPLSTSGNTIVDARGSRVILQGVNWFGFETANHAPHGL
jgi:endoglucanase